MQIEACRSAGFIQLTYLVRDKSTGFFNLLSLYCYLILLSCNTAGPTPPRSNIDLLQAVIQTSLFLIIRAKA